MSAQPEGPAEPPSVGAAADPALAPTVPDGLPEPPSARREVPRALRDRYEDIQFLGEGGMGTVYRASDPRLGRRVAIKLLKGDDPGLWRRFLVEARAQARIQHEHVCRVYEAGQAGSEPYIVMQLIDGEPLPRVTDRLTLEQKVKVMREIAAAVHEAHRLGTIHRDIKPANVMVEAREDGTYKPYIMDFGLAREVEEKGQTRTGVIMGTPAYMPPEQARGDVRAMDRRSDVYSLGATLYDLLAGRPPFEAEHSWRLLLKVAYDEPLALRKLASGVPDDLETIVMKCLERDPGRRYDSARALAEDLQRFLDGEPIRGKRASLAYVAWKKVRKHRLVTGLSAVMLVAALWVSIAWARAGRRAAEQARLAQALGEDVKEMELFLRNAYGMPLHDVERERDVVRRRLAEIEQRMNEGGPVAEGPGHYAIGRGALALGDMEGARAHLERALAAGYSSPDLEYALGRALGELYHRALAETQRITNEEERRKKVAELDAALRGPALSHLRAASAAKIEVPAYAEGLIALYEGRHEEALARAKEAFDRAPRMYEAKKLAGDALYAMGSRYRHDAAFDHEKMKSYFEPAAEAYRAAADAARSDPDAQQAECELWEKMGWAALVRGLPAVAPFDTARDACERAVRASSKEGKTRVQRALALSARLSAAGGGGGEQALREAESAVRAAEEAVQASPGDVMAHYAVARARLYRAERLRDAGQEVSVEPAISAYREAVEMDSRFTWAVNELGQAWLAAAEIDDAAGGDPRRAIDEAERQLDRASAMDPAFSISVHGKVRVAAFRLAVELARGTSTGAHVDALFRALPALEKRMGPGAWIVAYWKAKAHVLKGKHELATGRDPGQSAAAARAAVEAFAGSLSSDSRLLAQVVDSRLLEAEHALRQGISTRALAADLRGSIRAMTADRAAMSDPWRERAARVELLAARDPTRRAEPGDGVFEAALSYLEPALSKATRDPTLHQLAAEILAERAERLSGQGRDPAAAIAAGLARADEALAIHPHLAGALVARGRLLLVEARAARGTARAAGAARAKEAFDAAFRENPRLAEEQGPRLRDLAGLLR